MKLADQNGVWEYMGTRRQKRWERTAYVGSVGASVGGGAAGYVLHKLECGAEAPGKLEGAVKDVSEEDVVRAVLAQKAACCESA